METWPISANQILSGANSVFYHGGGQQGKGFDGDHLSPMITLHSSWRKDLWLGSMGPVRPTKMLFTVLPANWYFILLFLDSP